MGCAAPTKHGWINMCSFLIVFCMCYCLVAITNSYLVTAVQSLERQFQIPSRMSGTLMSASRLGYLSTVIILAYFGSKGNRARWIGSGCIIISIACLLIASPHFIFQRENTSPLNEDILFRNVSSQDIAVYRANQLDQDAAGAAISLDEMMAKPPVKQADDVNPGDDEKQISAVRQIRDVNRMAADHPKVPIGNLALDSSTKFAVQRPLSLEERSIVLKAASKSIGYCSGLVNKIRVALKDYKCTISDTNTAALTTIFVGIFIIGIGNTMPHTLGMPLVDDHVKRQNSPIFFGGIIVMRLMGPFTGYLLGGACSSIYYTLTEPQGLTTSDPRWIGAWWLGYLIVASALIIPAILMFFYPIDQIETKNDLAIKRGRDGKQRQDGQKADSHEDKALRPSITESMRSFDDSTKKKKFSLFREICAFKTAIVAILRSPIYTCALISRIIDSFGSSGFRGFGPKYLDNHYGMPVNKSATFLAPINLASVISGIIFGSVVMQKFKIDGRRAVTFTLVATVSSIIVDFVKSGLGCQSVVNRIGQIGKAVNFTFTSYCNQNCGCESVSLYPVCSRSGDMFYSACHAGCKSFTYSKESGMNLSNCACAEGGAVSRDWCQDDCQQMLAVYLCLNVMRGLIGGASIIPSVMIGLRSVPHKYRSVALAFSGFVTSLLSSFPSSIVYGFIIDTACLQWGDKCGQPGSCDIYDAAALRLRPHIFMGITSAISLIFDILIWYWAKDLKLLGEKTIDEKKQKKKKSKAADENPQDAKELVPLNGGPNIAITDANGKHIPSFPRDLSLSRQNTVACSDVEDENDNAEEEKQSDGHNSINEVHKLSMQSVHSDVSA